MNSSKTLVIVGCGAAKRDEAALARNLYTSTYFAKKREYAETIGDDWRILSAEHGLLDPYEKIEPYETSIDDLDGDELNRLAGNVGLSLIDQLGDGLAAGRGFDEIVVLAGRKYLDPLRERDAFAAGISEVVTFPLQQNDLAGIGEQMAWLSERISLENAEQTRLVTDGGERPSGEKERLARRYLGDDFNIDSVTIPIENCGLCGREAATGEDGCCRWCRTYQQEIAEVVHCE